MRYNKWTLRNFLDDLWHRSAGKKFTVKKPERMPSIDVLWETEWSKEYEVGCRMRMIMGAFRYGRLQKGNFMKYDLVKEIKRRLERYEKSGNLEFLLDCGNVCMLQFMKGKKNGQKVEAIDDGEHASEI